VASLSSRCTGPFQSCHSALCRAEQKLTCPSESPFWSLLALILIVVEPDCTQGFYGPFDEDLHLILRLSPLPHMADVLGKPTVA
jgi:hypothetical protein